MHAKAASHEELSHDRSQLAVKNCSALIAPRRPLSRPKPITSCCTATSASESWRKLAGRPKSKCPRSKNCSSSQATVRLSRAADKLTIYTFQKHYDYGEVGTMPEQPRNPPRVHGHWAKRATTWSTPMPAWSRRSTASIPWRPCSASRLPACTITSRTISALVLREGNRPGPGLGCADPSRTKRSCGSGTSGSCPAPAPARSPTTSHDLVPRIPKRPTCSATASSSR